jgi:hypothetical protein
MLRPIRHKNFLTTYEAFNDGDMIYIVSEQMEISLDHVIAAPRFPTENQLAEIAFQVRALQILIIFKN